MYEYLKKLFGKTEEGEHEALTFEQLSKKLEENKELKLVNLSEGGYVSKEKFEAKETEVAGLKEQLTSANSTIQSYKDMDIEGIKKSADDWQKKYNDDTKALQDKLAAQERSHNESMFLNDYKFTSKAAQAGIEALFVSKKFPYEDGKFIGAKEFMEDLKSNDDYKGAFKVEEQNPTPPTPPAEPPVPPRKPPEFSDPKPKEPNPPRKIGLAELMKRKNEDPAYQVKFD